MHQDPIKIKIKHIMLAMYTHGHFTLMHNETILHHGLF